MKLSHYSPYTRAMDLSAENVQAVFTDCLARASEATPSLRIHGVYNEFHFNFVRLKGHTGNICDFLGRLSTRFYVNRGGGHSYAAMGYRRDGEHWGGRPDIERLVTLGLGLGVVEYCLDRSLWHLFPSDMPFVRLPGDLFRLWATFRRPVGCGPGEAVRSLALAFRPEDHPTPLGVSDGQWYRPATFAVGDLGDVPTHVAASFYNGVVIDGFFNSSVPSWVLDPDTTLEVY